MELPKTGEPNPLLEAKLELENEILQFTPNLYEDSADGILAIVQNFVDDIYDMSSLMPRISAKVFEQPRPTTTASNGEPQDANQSKGALPGAEGNLENDTYLGEMKNLDNLSKIRKNIIERVSSIIEKGLTYREGYDQYTYLWTVCIVILNFRKTDKSI
jgi:dynein heavy chain